MLEDILLATYEIIILTLEICLVILDILIALRDHIRGASGHSSSMQPGQRTPDDTNLLQGKNVLITGIDLNPTQHAIAIELARRGANIHISGNDTAATSQIHESLQEHLGRAHPQMHTKLHIVPLKEPEWLHKPLNLFPKHPTATADTAATVTDTMTNDPKVAQATTTASVNPGPPTSVSTPLPMVLDEIPPTAIQPPVVLDTSHQASSQGSSTLAPNPPEPTSTTPSVPLLFDAIPTIPLPSAIPSPSLPIPLADAFANIARPPAVQLPGMPVLSSPAASTSSATNVLPSPATPLPAVQPGVVSAVPKHQAIMQWGILDDIERFAEHFRQQRTNLDILIHHPTTASNSTVISQSMSTTHSLHLLGPVQLTLLLEQSLASKTRVIFASSRLHRFGNLSTVAEGFRWRLFIMKLILYFWRWAVWLCLVITGHRHLASAFAFADGETQQLASIGMLAKRYSLDEVSERGGGNAESSESEPLLQEIRKKGIVVHAYDTGIFRSEYTWGQILILVPRHPLQALRELYAKCFGTATPSSAAELAVWLATTNDREVVDPKNNGSYWGRHVRRQTEAHTRLSL